MGAYKQQTVVAYTAATADAQKATAAQKKIAEAFETMTPYSPATVKLLEQYLDEQIQQNTVDIDANLELLKLYLVFPALSDKDKVAKILAKAIMTLPSTFFTSAAAMVSESLREDATIQKLLTAGFQLQSCLFEDFWKVELAFATKLNGFSDAVRAFILDVLSSSHSTISTATLKAKLNISDKQVKDLIAAEKWTLEKDNTVTLPANDDNQMRPKKIQENIALDDVLKVIHTLSR